MSASPFDSAGVTALVVAYHGDRWLEPCVSSLATASRHRLNLLLVDNSGNTVLPGLDLGAFDAECVITPRPLGFAEANNTALVEAAHLEGVVLFLNQDTISPPGWIDACLDCFRVDPTLGAVSPLIRTYDDTGWDPSFVACLPKRTSPDGLAADAPAGAVFETREVPAPALFVRTDVLTAVGPFDPIYGSYYEDYDLCRRIRAAGYRLGFARNAQVRHFSGSAVTSAERERRRMRQILRNRVIHTVRGQDGSRAVKLALHTLTDFPRRLARGVVGTSSSQPPAVTLGAYRDLLPLLPRLTSAVRDQEAWQAYLETLGWPPTERTVGVSP